ASAIDIPRFQAVPARLDQIVRDRLIAGMGTGPATLRETSPCVLRPLWVANGVSGDIVEIIETFKPVMLPNGRKGNVERSHVNFWFSMWLLIT
ncbi:hypothetical protein, partial [Kordiimonas sp.]|uniref:hypothetical protein n=1 Tax=Kordiimonas sp. TaxID=1970157 RepID=UPI003A93BF2D